MPQATVKNGTDESGVTRPTDANHGHVWYDETNRVAIIYDATLRLWFPLQGSSYIPNSSTGGLIADDYTESVLSTKNTVNRGTDTADAVNFANTGYSTVAGTTGNTGNFAADGITLTGPAWGAASTKAYSITRKVKISAITNVSIFVGMTDTAAFEEPMSLATTTFTTTASDAVGFLFDTAATAATIRFHSVKADVDNASPVNTGLAYVADTYRTFRIDVDTSGNATGYVDGVSIGTLTGAVTAGTTLYPVISATARSTATRLVTEDFVNLAS